MIINSQELIGLRTETKSGDYLGKVSGFDLETDSGKISRYYLKNPSLKNWFKIEQLIVSAEQVLVITREKMIVADLLIKEKEQIRGKAAPTVPVNNIEPIISQKA